MFRKLLWVGLCLALTAFGQADRGTITGTVTDPANAVVPNATVVARNADNGLVSQTTTTSTGSYTIPSVPAGNWDVSVEVAGFKKFTQNGITVRVAQTARVDVVLQVGSTSESVTVTSDAPLLNTENAEQTHNISGERLNALPINFGVSDGGYVRSPFAFINLMPGASNQAQNTVRVNGMPNNSHTMRFEGQESTNTNSARGVNEIQPSVEAIQDIALQTSNFAAEYGQVGGGLFNFTAKSGTNGLHGSAYIYFVNEVFNAGVPFTNAVKGGLVRPRARKNDWGGSFGGPVVIPKVYNGRNKTFFFLNWERYKENKQSTGTKSTVPSDLMRSGDFSQLLTGKGPIGTDRATGASILENAIYDPATSQTINGIVTRTPFAGNVVPFASQDPVALKIQALIPHATLPGVVNNFDQVYPQNKTIVIPSMKIDHMLNDRHKMSFYLSRFRIDQYVGGEGLPVPITSTRILYERSWTARLNYDWAVQPTFLMHFGIGFIHYSNPDVAMVDVLKYDAVGQLGLNGGIANNFVGTGTTGFPRINAISNSYGGLAMAMGPSNANKYKIDKPTAVMSGTYIKGNHTYKGGADWRIDTFEDKNVRGSSGNYTFAADESADPSTNGQGLSGVTGAPYASFLMGRVNSAFVSTPQYPRFSKKSLSLFVQDTWKVSRKLTFDYGVRWDYQGGARETHGRTGMFAPDVKNPSAGNILGAMIYDNGKNNFTTIYPYAIGPRLGAAYQLNSKTVFRAGWGVSYSRTTDFGYITNTPILGIGGWNTLNFYAPSFGDPASTLKNGLQYTNTDLYGHEQDIGIIPYLGKINTPPYYIDRNGGRPPRINQWTISLQREFTKDLVLEASYVGNRCVDSDC